MIAILSRIKYSLAYIACILVTVVLFNKFPLLIEVTDGASFSPWSAAIGLWFVLRDYSQRELGHYVFIPMVIGIAISAVVNPGYAIATALAGAVSELLDWAMYTFSKKPFHTRIFLSSLVAAPVDTFIFFLAFDVFQVIPGVSIFNWITIAIGTCSKLIAAIVIWFVYNKKTSGDDASIRV